MNCPKCNNILEEGLPIVFHDFYESNHSYQRISWIRKKVNMVRNEIIRKGLFGKEKRIEEIFHKSLKSTIIPYRCIECGYIEFYAKEVEECNIDPENKRNYYIR